MRVGSLHLKQLLPIFVKDRLKRPEDNNNDKIGAMQQQISQPS